MKNLTVRIKLLIIAVIALLSLSLSAIFSLSVAEKILNETLESKIRALVEVADGVAEHYYKQQKEGLLTKEEAMAGFRETIHEMRYNNGQEFYFVLDYEGKFVAMGGDPQLAYDSVSIYDFKDPVSGKFTTRVLIDKAKKGGDFDRHYWPKAGEDEPSHKIVYVSGFEPWDMLIGTGLYFDRIDIIYSEFRYELISLTLALAGFLAAALFWLYRSVSTPITRLLNAIRGLNSGEADLTSKLEVVGKDETGQTAEAFNQFIDRIKDVVLKIEHSAESVQTEALSSNTSAEELLKIAQQQKEGLEQVSTAFYEMVETANEVAKNSTTTASVSEDNGKKIEAGRQYIQSSVELIKELEHSVRHSNEAMSKLSVESDNIASILDTIRGIADQTNLLALNAAIEAARAGEAGRGFAVVADEVRDLAQKTSDSTSEIDNMIQGLSEQTEEVSTRLKQTGDKSQQVSSNISEMDEVFQSIEAAVFETQEMISQIATATEEQHQVAEKTNLSVSGVNDEAQKALDVSGNVKDAAQRLTATSQTLGELVRTFKVRDSK